MKKKHLLAALVAAAAAQLKDTSLRDAVNSLFAAIDDYLDG